MGGLLIGLIALASFGIANLRPVKTAHPVKMAANVQPYLKEPPPKPTASAPVRHLAPDGVYFTLRYFSVRGPHGVIGILPGTKVVRIRDVAPSILRVSAGDLQFDAKAQDLTNELDLAGAVSNLDAQRQKAVADYLDEERAIHQEQQDEENRLFDQEQRDIQKRRAAAEASWGNSLDSWPAGTNPLDMGAYNQSQDVVP